MKKLFIFRFYWNNRGRKAVFVRCGTEEIRSRLTKIYGTHTHTHTCRARRFLSYSSESFIHFIYRAVERNPYLRLLCSRKQNCLVPMLPLVDWYIIIESYLISILFSKKKKKTSATATATTKKICDHNGKGSYYYIHVLTIIKWS